MFEHMTIKEIAEICHCSTRTLRYYEEIGLIKPSRMENNYRVYSFDAVSRVEVILMLKKTGMQLDQIRRELSNYRNIEGLLEMQRRLLEEEKQRIDQTLSFIGNQQKMLALYQKYGLENLCFDECFCNDYEIVRRMEKKEIVVRMEYDELFMAIDARDEPDVYMVRRKPSGTHKRVAAVFLSDEHRIRRRQKRFLELMREQGCTCESLICSESCCLLENKDVHFMWCEFAK